MKLLLNTVVTTGLQLAKHFYVTGADAKFAQSKQSIMGV